MTVRELIAALRQFDPEAEIKVWDMNWQDIEMLVSETRATRGKTVAIYTKPEDE